MKHETRYPFPKVELHLHLDGSLRPEFMWELGKKEGVELPTETLEEFRLWIKETSDCHDISQYLERFELPLQVLQKKEYLTRATEELIDDLADWGYGYAEIRYAPQLHLREEMSQRDSIEAVLLGRENALARHPEMGVGILLCAMSYQSETANMEENLETVRLAKDYLGKGVVGIDLAGAEETVPVSNFHAIFDLAKELEIPFTCHGESFKWGWKVVEDVMDLGSPRVGHGHQVWENPELVKRAVREKTTFEICPTSNVQCSTRPSYPEHPAKKMLDAGIHVTISTDNRTLAALTLDDEYDHCVNEIGFTYNDLIQMNIYAAEAAFMPETDRAELIAKLKTFQSAGK